MSNNDNKGQREDNAGELRKTIEQALDGTHIEDGTVSAFNSVVDELTAAIAAHLARQAQAGAQNTPFPERDLSKPAEQQGLFRKFDVRRVDGSDQPGGKHYGCRYYVLDLNHDQHAPAAMRAYAASCRATHPQLAADIETEFGAQNAEAIRNQADTEPKPLNGIPATMMHDEGAIARCSYCHRYSLDPATLGPDSRQPVCECGKQHGWSGSFKRPGPDAKWSGTAPSQSGTATKTGDAE